VDGAPPLSSVITVCDSAAAEECPANPALAVNYPRNGSQGISAVFKRRVRRLRWNGFKAQLQRPCCAMTVAWRLIEGETINRAVYYTWAGSGLECGKYAIA
jgi:hypothetical protein